MKLLQASLSLRKDVEGSFYHSGDPVRLVQTCLKMQERPDKAVLTAEEEL